jgi:hypothetical protein
MDFSPCWVLHDGKANPANWQEGNRLDTPCRIAIECPPDGWAAAYMGIEQKRLENERKFGTWEQLPIGGRRYYLEVPGLHGWMARYVKEVDGEERTLQFFQEIFDENRCLVEIHEKYPIDKGHVRVERK